MKSKIQLKYLILISVTLAVVMLDQWTKFTVVQRFQYGETMPIWSDLFSLTYVRNPGAAFGILARWDASLRVPFFVIVPIVALVVVGTIFRRLPRNDIKMAMALSLVIGGAIGNLIDRATYGYVVDFLDFHWGFWGPHFPAFNVADIAICVGVFFLILDLYKKDLVAQKEQLHAPHSD